MSREERIERMMWDLANAAREASLNLGVPISEGTDDLELAERGAYLIRQYAALTKAILGGSRRALGEVFFKEKMSPEGKEPTTTGKVP